MPEAAAWQFKDVKRVPAKRSPDEIVARGRVFTGDSDSAIDDGFVRIERGKITAVGAASDLGSGAEGALVVGGPDKTVLPGLFNNHAHLAWDGANDLAAQALEDEPEISAYKCAANMLRSLRAGVTTVRDLGMNKTGLLREAGGRAGHLPTDRSCLSAERRSSRPAAIRTGVAARRPAPDEMRRAVREQVRGGADLIKIMGCHDLLEFTDEELDAVVDETHRNGLKITAHATFDACIRRMLEHGVDTIEHGGAMSDETIQLLVDRGTYIITTFAPLVMQAAEGEAWGMPAWKVEERKKRTRRQVPLRGARAGSRSWRADRLRDGRGKPGRAPRRNRAGARLHG